MNSASSVVHTSSQWLMGTAIAAAPAAARSVNPAAIVRTSRMTMCFRNAEYAINSTKYAAAVWKNRQPSAHDVIIAATPTIAAAASATAGLSAPGRDGPMRLQRMAPILLSIEHVVDEVDRRGERAEHAEGDDRLQHRAVIVEPLGEHQGRKDEEVLRPLTRAQ